MSYKKTLLVLFLIMFIFINLNLVVAGEIVSVRWDKIKVKDSEGRYVIINTKDFSDGTNVKVEIWENDCIVGIGCPDDDPIENLTGQIFNNKAILAWDNAKDNHRDGLNGFGEYYALVKIGNLQKYSKELILKKSGLMGYGKSDCGGIIVGEGDAQCQNKLYCEGIPDLLDINLDGCCFDYENFNVDKKLCNLAITGQVFDVSSKSNGEFNSREFSNLNLFFVGYDDTNLLKKLITPVFIDYIKADNDGRFNYNPEFNRENTWNVNILFDWNIEVYAFNQNNQLLGGWTNSYSNDLSKYTRGNEYLEQIVRIHTDKPYWRDDIADDAPVGIASLSGSQINSIEVASTSFKSSVNPKQSEQIKLIKKVLFNNKNSRLRIQSSNSLASQISGLENNTVEDSESSSEKVLYAIWEGILEIEEDNVYYFNSSIEGGYKLKIDERVIYDGLFDTKTVENPIFLSQGNHNLSVEYVNLMELAAPNLIWRTPNQEDYLLISKSLLRRKTLDFQFYSVSSKEQIEPISKFDEVDNIETFVRESSSNQLSAIALSSNPYYQISYLETPAKEIKPEITPLLLIHGIHGESGYFDGQFEDNLKKKGYETWKFYYPNDQKIVYSASLLSDALTYLTSKYNDKKVNVVAHSMGGLVTRAYMQNMAKDPNGVTFGYNDDINKMVMLGTPNNGAHIANHVRGFGDLGVICNLINEVVGRLITGKSFVEIRPDEPAYEDLSVGSQFLWDLNLRNISNSENVLIISGQQDAYTSLLGIPCVPYEADKSDSLVAVTSASKIDENIPLIVLNKNHITLYKRLGKDLDLMDLILEYFDPSDFSFVKPLILQFLAIITDTGDIVDIIDDFILGKDYSGHLDNGEFLLAQGNSFSSSSLPEGMASIKFTNVEVVDKNSVVIKNETNEYKFIQNPDSKIFYHYNPVVGSIDRGLTIPKGAYDLYVNNRDSFNDVEIKSAQTNYFEFYSCNANWSLQENWSICITNDLQFKDWIDLRSCNLNITKPSVFNQSCDYCLPNWTKVNTGCLLGDFSADWYNDTNSCFAKTNLTPDLIGKVENITYPFSCDFDKDGFIGNVSHINTTIKNISRIKRNNTFEFMEGNKTLFSFEFNATNNSVNLVELMIDKNSENSTFGYLIIKGLDLSSQNKTKTVYLDRILNGTGICIKDEELGAVSEVSDSCSSSNETWMFCPGINGQYSCNLTENSSQYIISGLRHSGIKEQSTFCGDNICNGVESCNSCSADCGSCPVVSEPPSGGGGGGGGSGGGSSSRGGSISAVAKKITQANITTVEIPVETNQTEEFVSLDNNQTNVTQQGGRSFLTGAVIGVGGFVKSKVGIIVLIFVLIIGVIIGGGAYVKNKNTPRVKFPKSKEEPQGFYYGITTQVCKYCGKDNSKWRRFCQHCDKRLRF